MYILGSLLTIGVSILLVVSVLLMPYIMKYFAYGCLSFVYVLLMFMCYCVSGSNEYYKFHVLDNGSYLSSPRKKYEPR